MTIYPIICISHTIDNAAKDLLNSPGDIILAAAFFPGAKKGIIPLVLETLSNLVRRDPDLYRKIHEVCPSEMPNGVDSRFNYFLDVIIYLLSQGPASHPTFDLHNNRLADLLPVLRSYLHESAKLEDHKIREQRRRKREAASKAPAPAAKPTARYSLRKRPAPAPPEEPEEIEDEPEEDERAPLLTARRRDPLGKDLSTVLAILSDETVVARMFAYLEAARRLREDLVWSMSSSNRSMLLYHRLKETRRLLEEATIHPEATFKLTSGIHIGDSQFIPQLCRQAAETVLRSHISRFERYLHVPFSPAALCDKRETQQVARELLVETRENIWQGQAAKVLGDAGLAPTTRRSRTPCTACCARPGGRSWSLQGLAGGKPIEEYPALEVILHSIYDAMPLNQDLPVKQWQWRAARQQYEEKARQERALSRKRRAEASKSSGGRKKSRASAGAPPCLPGVTGAFDPCAPCAPCAPYAPYAYAPYAPCAPCACIPYACTPFACTPYAPYAPFACAPFAPHIPQPPPEYFNLPSPLPLPGMPPRAVGGVPPPPGLRPVMLTRH
ncbi:hypothetical protein PAPYR_4098 [Paratrimastix pyriformis]|uniref:Uncharacterized protein n=1 Tax=Paratrimastix pyriformis TaxID=342808 RepID=A0ABQ8UMM3_9EUKA|nr:hypothetical protein PAPYR_4098 [Paratrimastix pyriformis]